MKIIALILKDYKRLALNNINYIEYRPDNKIQLILGTNGSGKSSLLKELTPLPAVPSEYEKGGYKLIEISHNNSLYRLKNTFTKTDNQFSFIKDNVELNRGLTVTVYKELISQEFNLTVDTHNLMCGVTNFHSMSISERRSWFTKISDIDYNYAFKYYNKLKDQLRDIQGGIKLNQSRYIQESSKIISEDEEKSIRSELVFLNKWLGSILESKTTRTADKSELKKQLNTFEVDLTELNKSILADRSKFTNEENFSSLEDIDKTIVDYTAKLAVSQSKIEHLCSIIDKDQSSLDVLAKANNNSIDDLRADNFKLLEQIKDYEKQLYLTLEFTQLTETLTDIKSVKPYINDVLINLEPDSNKINNINYYNSLLEKKTHLLSELTILDKEYMVMINRRSELEHLRDHKKVTCPRCSHIWSLGYDDDIYKELIKDIESRSNIIGKIKSHIDKLDSEITSIKDYLQAYNLYRKYMSNYPLLKPLERHIDELLLLHTNPRSIINLFEECIYYLSIKIEIDKLYKNIKDNDQLIEMLLKNNEQDSQKLESSIESNTKILNSIYSDINRYKSYITKLNFYKSLVKTIEQKANTLETLIENRYKKGKELIDLYRQDAINEVIKILRLEISDKEQRVSQINNQKILVTDIESQIKTLKEREEVLKIAVKKLSPTEGLIAKSISGFINQFVQQINDFIKKIWLYPLELIPIYPNDNNSIDLDYKFMVRINDSYTISDINKGSSAMKEIIDLAFRLVSMNYLGFMDFPLYLDEFAIRMDVSHREAAFHVINQLIMSSNFSQIYIISHYENSYGSLVNSDIIVLCPNNISLDKDTAFNKVVKFN